MADLEIVHDFSALGTTAARRSVGIPRKGRPGKARQAHEHRRTFRRTVKWRTGSEARISTLKRQYEPPWVQERLLI
jgi:IS5 family transposase